MESRGGPWFGEFITSCYSFVMTTYQWTKMGRWLLVTCGVLMVMAWMANPTYRAYWVSYIQRLGPLIQRLRWHESVPIQKAHEAMTPPWPKGATPLKAPIGAHFNTNASPFVLALSDTTAYAEPSNQPPPPKVTHLQAGQRVRIVYRHPSKWGTSHRGAGPWVFIVDEKANYALGWVIESQLASPTQFKPVSGMPWAYLGLCVGDYCGEFTIKSTGRFEEKWDAIGQGIQLNGVNWGQVYQYGPFLWFKQDRSADFDEWLIWDGQQLKMEPKYESEPLRMGPNRGTRLRSPQS